MKSAATNADLERALARASIAEGRAERAEEGRAKAEAESHQRMRMEVTLVHRNSEIVTAQHALAVRNAMLEERAAILRELADARLAHIRALEKAS